MRVGGPFKIGLPASEAPEHARELLGDGWGLAVVDGLLHLGPLSVQSVCLAHGWFC
jgi:hypothetical protein